MYNVFSNLSLVMFFKIHFALYATQWWKPISRYSCYPRRDLDAAWFCPDIISVVFFATLTLLPQKKTKKHNTQLLMQGVPSFEQTLDSPELRNVFLSFLQKNHQAETLLFVEHVEKYFLYKSDAMRYQLAQQIINQFLNKNSACEINVPANLRDELQGKFATCTSLNCPRSLFEVVNDLVLVQLKTETFAAFLKSTAYLDYVMQTNNTKNNKRQFKKSPRWVVEHATNPYDQDVVDAVAESLWHLSEAEEPEDVDKCAQLVKMMDDNYLNDVPSLIVEMAATDSTAATNNCVASPNNILQSPAFGPIFYTPKSKPIELDDDVEKTFRRIFWRKGTKWKWLIYCLGLPLKRYKALLKTYKHSFLPSDLLSFMTNTMNLSKEQAMEYIAEFEKRNYMAPLIKSLKFDASCKTYWRMLKKRRVVIIGMFKNLTTYCYKVVDLLVPLWPMD